MRYCVILFTLCQLSFVSAFAQTLKVYSEIPGRMPSDKYQCRVREICSNFWQDAFTGQTYSQPASPDGNGYVAHINGWSASWIAFEFDSTTVVVEIAKADGSPIQSAKVRPEGAASEAIIENGKVYVTFNTHANVNVDIDGQMEDQYTGMFYSGPPVHTISLFGNPVFHVPDTTNPSVHYLQPGDSIPSDFSTWDTIYFAPGIHHIGTPFQIQTNKTLFIPGNAIVHGTIHPPDVWGENTSRNWSVYGSGAISGEEIPHWSTGALDGQLSKVFTGPAHSVKLEGFVVIDPAHHTFNMITSDFSDTTRRNVYRNLKILGWRVNGDGLNAFYNAEVTNCFFRCQDDHFYYGGDHVKISDCVTWSDVNGAVLRLHKGSSTPGSSYFKNIRSIYHRNFWHYHGGGGNVISSGFTEGENISNVYISNILVEDPHPSLPTYTFEMSEDTDATTPTTFNNVIIERVIQINPGTPNAWGDEAFYAPQNFLHGSDSSGMYSNLVFKNCYYGGSWIGSFSEGNFNVNDYQSNIQFILDDTLNHLPPAYTGPINGAWPTIPSQPIIQSDSLLLLCNGESITLTSNAQGDLIWSTGELGSEITVSQEGNYFLTSSNGICTSTSDTVEVSTMNLIAGLTSSDNLVLIVGDNALIAAGCNQPEASFQWQVFDGSSYQNISDGLQYSGTNDDTLLVLNLSTANNNQIFRCVINAASCSDTTEQATLIVSTISSIGDFADHTKFFIAPNPASNQVNMSVASSYTLYSSEGAFIKASIQPVTQIDLSDLPNGLYYLKCQYGYFRFVKTN